MQTKLQFFLELLLLCVAHHIAGSGVGDHGGDLHLLFGAGIRGEQTTESLEGSKPDFVRHHDDRQPNLGIATVVEDF